MATTRKIKEFGLSEVWSSPEKPAQVDVVLVHGLNGHPKQTWTSKTADTFWPVDVLPDFLEGLRVRVLTYGYNSNVTSFTDGASRDRIHHHAETLAGELHANRSLRNCLERPIIFVCHSLGGLVVKRCLIMCRSVENERIRHLRSIYVSTFGILFLGTPHTGSDVAKWGLLLQKICSAVFPKRFLDTSPQLIEALKSNNETLQNINRLFNESFSRFHIYFFHETKPLDLKGTREFIVDEASAAPDIEGAERFGIEADHSSMVKFEDDSSPGFEAVAEAIVRYSREAPTVIASRWVEEKAHVHLQNQSRANEIIGPSLDLPGKSSREEAQGRMGSSVPTLPPHNTGLSVENTPRMSHSVENLPSSRPPLFVVPPGFHPNATFIGMEKELSELHSRLFKAKKRTQRVAAVLISGGPGSGKTHLAREYVHRHRRDYPGGVFWIDAKSILSTSTCYWDVARAAALTSDSDATQPPSTSTNIYVDEVRHWFESREEWLLVFDGLGFDEDSQLNAFKKYLPFTKNSSILYTSVDRTLAKKQRLFEPYCLTVRPLQVEEARHLLFKDLDIKKPTPEQSRKATEIVNHYQCLPLAIHAISHRLRATRKPLEKYHIGSHLTDQKLAEPFLGIMDDLSANNHYEALNLINLLSFFGHHVPVGLLTWGKSALETLDIRILTSSRLGEPGDIDTTLGLLIQYGLIERVSDPYTSRSFVTEDSDKVHDSPENETPTWSSESFTDCSQDTTTGVYQSTIDVIKIHSVVQGFCRDELKSQDQEIKQRRIEAGLQNARSAEEGPGYFLSWLLAATKVYYKSYENARSKMNKDRTGSLFVKDLREYETHAERIMNHYKRVNARSCVDLVKDAKQSLRDVVKDIKNEIASVSPNRSEESLRHEKSIFDRSSSSSSAPSSSMEDSAVSRRSTWNGADDESVRVESPLDMVRSEQPDQVRLDLFPPHIYRESTDENDDGYLTDGEAHKTLSRRPSVTPSQLSQITEKPPTVDESLSDDSGWEIVKNKKEASKAKEPVLKNPMRKKGKFRGKFRRDLGSYRQVPALTKLSSAQGKGAMSRPVSTSEKNAKYPNAQSILAPYRKPHPQEVAEDSKRPPVAPMPQKENQRSWATVAAPQGAAPMALKMPSFSSSDGSVQSSSNINRDPPFLAPRLPLRRKPGLQTELSMESRSSGQSSSSIPSPVSSEFKQSHLNPLSRSDPALVPGRIARDARSAPGSRYHSRHASAIPDSARELSTSPPHRLRDLTLEDLNFSQRIAITSERRFLSPQRSPFQPPPLSDAIHEVPTPVRGRSPSAHPSAIMPGSPPPPFPPDGYTSEPLSAPMSRDTSGQSHDSWQTEPAPYSRSLSQAPAIGYGYNVPLVNTGAVVMAPGGPSYVVPTAPPVFSPTPLRSRVEYGGEPNSERRILFGEHEVDVNQARQRVDAWNERQITTAAAVTPAVAYNLGIPQPLPRMRPRVSDTGPIMLETPVIPVIPSGPRSRAGSSPPAPDHHGLGLHLGTQFPRDNNI
ncbi:ATPase family AAA domain-containing protein 2B [Talaromyces islandicus]|uniref:ATPase family AAA domain-containing protein 2B n=1 Tax=Talaromyces islandicus TaxID=28573 RepID=A0A0U1LRR9_TALIS|nr:ATPase family AAA domain-containing protein 2B [Talaromyces islandicus]